MPGIIVSTVITLQIIDQEHENKIAQIVADHNGLASLNLDTLHVGKDVRGARITLQGGSDMFVNEQTIQRLNNLSA